MPIKGQIAGRGLVTKILKIVSAATAVAICSIFLP
jgi:hypothetical protein